MRLLAALVVLALGLSAAGAYAAEPPPVELIGITTVWRSFRQLVPQPITPPAKPTEQDKGADNYYSVVDLGGGVGFPGRYPTSLAPPPDWMQTDFDDQAWAFSSSDGFCRDDDGRRGTYGILSDRGLASGQWRARFGVSDPAKVKGLVLSLSYRGGVIVYVNGREIGRKDMPQGAVTSTTPALD